MTTTHPTRRGPFANTRIAARGQRTQQRIVDAALRVFTEDGYHRGSIERIAKLGGCSRVSFYQYFASKEDVFRHLVALVSRQLAASTDALDPLTAAADGRDAMRAWVGRYAEIYARYQPVFNAYAAGVDSGQNATRLHARLVDPALPDRRLDAVIRLLLECVTHTLDMSGVLDFAAPGAYPLARVYDAITDVVHRTLFGPVPGVNLAHRAGPAPPPLAFAPAERRRLRNDAPPVRGACAALLASAPAVFVARGYHGTRVDDVVTAAGVSHGAFYRYFRDKAELARALNAGAVRGIGRTLTDLPDASADPRALRKWLRHYNAVHAQEAAVLRVWVDAALHDPVLKAESAPALDWGRRRMARFLHARTFGDADMDAVVLIALLGVFGARQRTAAEVAAAADVIERGLLARSENT